MELDAKLIGNKIKEIRKSAHKSQEGFAETIDTSARTVCNIENGVVLPSLQTVVNIAEQFKSSVDDIVGNPKKDKNDE